MRRDYPFLRAYLRQIDWVENAVDALGVNGSGLGAAFIAPRTYGPDGC